MQKSEVWVENGRKIIDQSKRSIYEGSKEWLFTRDAIIGETGEDYQVSRGIGHRASRCSLTNQIVTCAVFEKVGRGK